MAEKDSTTLDNGVVERLKEDYDAIDKARRLLDTMGAIAFNGMLAVNGGEYGQEGLAIFLESTESPWNTKHLQENTYETILKLAGEAWQLLNETANLDHLLKKFAPAPLAPEGGE